MDSRMLTALALNGRIPSDRPALFPRESITPSDTADHVDHLGQLGGNSRHAAIDSTDGQGGSEGAPADVEADMLTQRGCSADDVDNIMFSNWLLKNILQFLSTANASSAIREQNLRPSSRPVSSMKHFIPIVLCTLFTSDLVATEPIEVGSRKQLFVDDFLIESHDGARWKFHQPEKANEGQPVLQLDRAWEQVGANILGGVVRDNGRFRMWYRGGGGGPAGGVWCYAESEDGLLWKKPSLGLIEHDGRRQNNIYVWGQPQAFTPFIDRNEDRPAHRYKSAVNSLRIDTSLAYSADGLVWNQYQNGAAITGRASDTISQVLWDPYARVYRLYTRTDYGTSKTGEVRGTRDMVAAADADLSDPDSWHKVREWCLGWETHPPVIAGAEKKGRGYDPGYYRKRQLYSVNGWIHEGVQFALIWALETGPDENGLRETMNAYLATTRGDQMWNLDRIYNGQPLISRGAEGRFDCRWIQPAPAVVTWKDRHWIYYSGQARSHANQWSPNITGPKGGIGLATIRRDGFISIRADKEEASVVTKPMRFQGSRLSINALTSSGGSIRIEIQDSSGDAIPGFTLNDSRAFTGDELSGTMTWNNRTDLSDLAGKPIRLKIMFRNADIFALRFANPKDASPFPSPN